MKKRIPYWYLLLPFLCGYLGSACNIAALAANNQRMPVYYDTCTPELLNDTDLLHTCLTKETRLKPLTDWIRIPHEGWISIGDLFIDIYDSFRFPCLAIWMALILRGLRASQP